MKQILALSCCLLLTVIAAEAFYGPGNNGTDRQKAGLEHPVDQRAKPTAPSRSAFDQWQASILARPLFTPDRKPSPGSVAVSKGLPRLAGVVASPNNAVAIFQPTGDGRPLVVHRGDTVGGWEVAMIAGSTVSLRKAADVLVLQPDFGNSAAAAGGKNIKQPQSRWEAAATTGVLRARWSNPQLQP